MTLSCRKLPVSKHCDIAIRYLLEYIAVFLSDTRLGAAAVVLDFDLLLRRCRCLAHTPEQETAFRIDEN